jgi:16S rRNA (guanine527-N7)-methyltransferase
LLGKAFFSLVIGWYNLFFGGIHALDYLLKGIAYLGLSLNEASERQFQIYLKELDYWNRYVNLTSVTRPNEVEKIHFLDSISVAIGIPEFLRGGCDLVDVGSGAGFPGLPLKINFPEISVTLVESVIKKTAFLNHIVNVLNLRDVNVLADRAEVIGKHPSFRHQFDVAVSRAVGSLRVLAELVLPFCRVGGIAILSKKGNIAQEVREAKHAFEIMGGEVTSLTPIPETVLSGQRCLVILRKIHPTPDGYPRRPGIPAKRPL